MTTIAVRDGVMAADSCYNEKGFVLPLGSFGPKITRLSDGSLFASAGDTAEGERLRAWVEAGRGDEGPTVSLDGDNEPETEAIVLRPDGTIWVTSGSPAVLLRVCCDWYALGSGFEIAMTAMHLGKSAAEAVAVACDLDRNSARPVLAERV